MFVVERGKGAGIGVGVTAKHDFHHSRSLDHCSTNGIGERGTDSESPAGIDDEQASPKSQYVGGRCRIPVH